MSKYCQSTAKTIRWKTREVLVGNVGVGGNNPIRIQSMTTSSTRDVEKTIEQIVKLADAGCEIARVTVQGIKEAEACEGIKNGLLKKGYSIPLVADIHFYPPAAMAVIDFVEKVRINPGNYIDKRASFKTIEYDDHSYALELEKIEEKFTPLVEKCKKLKRAMRIGTNHGSLSDRIMNRYGDTPYGMLESALEFARVCRKNDYHDFVFSMKSSNPSVMILAYRLLVSEMMKLGWDYPLHLGVTEAGEGEDGRIKSAMGIGSLLLDGIGDTIRVSLTEDAWNEIEPCKRLISLTNNYSKYSTGSFEEQYRQFEQLKKREVILPKNISLHRDGTVFVSTSSRDFDNTFSIYKKLGCDGPMGKPKIKFSSADGIIANQNYFDPTTLQILFDLKNCGISILSENAKSDQIPILNIQEAVARKKLLVSEQLFKTSPLLNTPIVVKIQDEEPNEWEVLEKLQPSIIFLNPSQDRIHYCRHFFDWLQRKNIKAPVIFNFKYECSKEDLIIQAAAEMGSLFCDGYGDGILIEGPYEIDFIRNLSFNILQAARLRTSKTDFISCPSCGRTLFDLQEVSKKIRDRTSHLPGVKIAIMGCIVNGPGEMADADFGYVGSKPGMIDLYVGKTCVEKDILFNDAENRLVELIKKHNRWVDPEKVENCQH